MGRLLKFWVVLVISFVSVIPEFLIAAKLSKPRHYLRFHNDARRKVGVEPLKWDKELKVYAHKYVNESISHCDSFRYAKSEFGQNIVHFKYSPGFHPTALDAVTYFVDQEKYYDYKTNSCTDEQNMCHRYTQVVWHTTTSVGCYRKQCLYNKGTLFACYYNPPGNIPNERPY